MSKNDKKTKKETSANDAQNLLRRLTRSEAARSKKAQGTELAEETLTMTGEYDRPCDLDTMVPASSRKAKTLQVKLHDENEPQSDMTDAELKVLFDRYLGSAAETSEPVSYDEVHQQILDAEERAGLGTVTKTDVEKNIDEAERYIDSITEKTEKAALPGDDLLADATGGFALDIRDTEQLGAFEPMSEDGDIKGETYETRVLYAQETMESSVPDMPTDTAMMKAFGLDPKTAEIMRDERLFDDIRFSATTELTEEVAAQTEEFLEEESIPEEPQKTSGSFEYVDPAQNKDIFAVFKSKYNVAKVRLILAAALALLLGLLENIPAVADIFGSNINFIAVDWALTLVAAVLIFDRLIAAVKSLAKLDFDCDSVALFTLVLSLVATGVSLFTAASYETVYLYNFPFAICVFLNILNVFITLRRDVYSFKVVSSMRPKQVLVRAGSENEGVPERMDFSDYLAEDENVCTVRKTDFISSFFAHREEKANSKFLLKIFIPECLIFSALFFIVSYFVMNNSMTVSLGTAYSSFLMSAPFSAFIAYSYPLYLASRRAYTYHSAIIGDKTHENYERTAVVAFRDDEAFPAGKTKVKSLKLYADRKIENVMYYASSVYAKIGGPLATVFKQATLNSVISADVELLEVSENGVSAMVDGKNIVIGRPEYMESQCFETVYDAGDENYEGNTNKRILYLACEQVVIAKFYLQYTTTSDFLYMVHHLADAGVGISIRTADPCIDDGVLYPNKMSPEEYPVKVIKGVLPEEKASQISAKAGGIVTVGSAKELVKTFLLCAKIENVRKTNFILKTVASILGIAVMVLVLFTGNAAEMRSIFPALYQLFWLLPIYCVSKIYI